MKIFKLMKFDTRGNENVSSAIQEMLFDQGYEWPCNPSNQVLKDRHFIYTNSYGRLAWDGGTFTRFATERGQYETINIDWMFAPEPTTVEIPGLGTYDAAQVAERLKELKPL